MDEQLTTKCTKCNHIYKNRCAKKSLLCDKIRIYNFFNIASYYKDEICQCKVNNTCKSKFKD